jgi:hypothetical protein
MGMRSPTDIIATRVPYTMAHLILDDLHAAGYEIWSTRIRENLERAVAEMDRRVTTLERHDA